MLTRKYYTWLKRLCQTLASFAPSQVTSKSLMRLAPAHNDIKLFTSVHYELQSFPNRLVGKASSLPWCGERRLLPHSQTLDETGKAFQEKKHIISSRTFVKYRRKKFFNIGPWSLPDIEWRHPRCNWASSEVSTTKLPSFWGGRRRRWGGPLKSVYSRSDQSDRFCRKICRRSEDWPGVNVINFFSSFLALQSNKLECLSPVFFSEKDLKIIGSKFSPTICKLKCDPKLNFSTFNQTS